MAQAYEIRENMQVLGLDGGVVGRVDKVEGDRIKLNREPAGGPHHFVPLAWVSRIDEHVHLDRDSAAARGGWTQETMSSETGATGPAAASGSIHEGAHDRRKMNWIPWILGALLLALVIFLLFRGLGYASREPNYEDNAKGELTEQERQESGASSAVGNNAQE